MAETPPERPKVGSALDEANDAFHDTYDRACADEKEGAPVIVVLADDLVVFRRGQRSQVHVTPRIFHVIKAAAHVPVALFSAAYRDDAEALGRLRAHVAASLASLDGETDLDEEISRAVRGVLDESLALVDGGYPPAALAAFAKATGAKLLVLTHCATRLQLQALHEAVEAVLRELEPAERRHLQVVVTGNHQTRARSLGMQYFRKRLEEPEGAEERVVYAEGVETADEARALVGTRRMDARIAEAFFGDAKRLQRDVLGDSVKKLLSKTELDPIR